MLKIEPYFTSLSEQAEDLVEWTKSDVVIKRGDGSVVFSQERVEHPVGWSEAALRIVAQKYFAKSPECYESSVKQMVRRVVGRIAAEGVKGGYFDKETAEFFENELALLVYQQRMSFNSPVWFNIGRPDRRQQASACFILDVDDSMEAILNWYTEEGKIFAGGSGAGVNLSKIRGSKERIRGGGIASGPVSFMRGADASAGTIKSGGTTRRAAKMAVLNVDHPDIQEFIWCKAREERKALALSAAGFAMGIDGADSHSVQYQNANNSVRVTDDFMEAAINDRPFRLTNRVDGSVAEKVQASSLLGDIAQAAWECADPGVQFHDAVNYWHTTPRAGAIVASNPCSEFMHINNSSCNLASLNLAAFQDGDWDAFHQAVRLTIIAQEILVGFAEYPTAAITDVSRRFRQLGLGYANLGGHLMRRGVPYDSERGRRFAADVTSRMTAVAYRTSAELASVVGPFYDWDVHGDDSLRVLRQHRSASEKAALDTALWDEAIDAAQGYGLRNSQVSLLAPTGTIGLMMDCDTTGIEPAIALTATKTLVGGGTMIVGAPGLEHGLRALGYSVNAINRVMSHVAETGVLAGSEIEDEHLAVFATALGENCISPLGHLRMMAAVQPFLSGAISKTVNLPQGTTVEEIRDLIVWSWENGLKAVAFYRDGCKVAQPVNTPRNRSPLDPIDAPLATLGRKKPPRKRQATVYDVMIGDLKLFVTIGQYDDGRPCEVFFEASRSGSTMNGLFGTIGILISHALQYGVPLEDIVESLKGRKFSPAGITNDDDVRFVESVPDWLAKRLEQDFLSEASQIEVKPVSKKLSGDLCISCGGLLQRAGSCMVCPNCGTTTGCS